MHAVTHEQRSEEVLKGQSWPSALFETLFLSRLPLCTPRYLAHMFSGILLSPPSSCLGSTEITGLHYHVRPYMSSEESNSGPQACLACALPTEPPSQPQNFFFFLNNIVSGVVPLCRFHCAQPSPGSLTNASFPCYLNPGNAVNILRVPEASVLGPSLNTGLHGHAGLCTSGLTLARNVCTSSCTLSVNFALLRTTSTSQVCVNSC